MMTDALASALPVLAGWLGPIVHALRRWPRRSGAHLLRSQGDRAIALAPPAHRGADESRPESEPSRTVSGSSASSSRRAFVGLRRLEAAARVSSLRLAGRDFEDLVVGQSEDLLLGVGELLVRNVAKSALAKDVLLGEGSAFARWRRRR